MTEGDRGMELRILLKTVSRKHSLQDLCIVSLLAGTGLRSHEIAQLRVKDLNCDEHYLMAAVKGGWYKRTPLSAVIAQTLREYLQSRPAPEGEQVLFHNQWGNPIDKHWILRMIKRAAAPAGIQRRVNTRMLHHAFATYAADRHGKEVTKALPGHAAGHNTDIYMHPVPLKYRPIMNKHPYQTQLPLKTDRCSDQR